MEIKRDDLKQYLDDIRNNNAEYLSMERLLFLKTVVVNFLKTATTVRKTYKLLLSIILLLIIPLLIYKLILPVVPLTLVYFYICYCLHKMDLISSVYDDILEKVEVLINK